ncbi:hypothetical protein DDB_G0274257 [Dictyostelium discoideum AX4]|uniref:Bis(5'-adenosyl)-triphosphatase n=1 Tax=Dictyostelium discoideum TaxID=44689 RepID=FHIT_DICDI|nr:hypothetical protein DDB_G0274257 [Dictyostelium discoideum AX4]Q86KK2.1 RecName: Full=Bis(5'-adenosyl)-triphosphatase; AltName: Full=AP3A hydrolase; Short=AP3Aase; AltName: Full=Diadenosine 5',5'''-P1,P3-triphosphate hydrolase; AltName: Full=Dinucleosidetriphosphatase; AltName: Full=Fragile histidine triad protein homolog [Dictyostelium discoideum]EAL70021.1 hypothetical protein DDB_G0274257 [Dictyostelium discoideum AX4]|eukprot:XP_644016.1 hypothetical protein DDB_G0274257 [Dictyostelium discoideum AX4]
MTTTYFGPWLIRQSEIFFTTELSFALVNLKPVLPGHVLVCPKRIVPRVKDLTKEEFTDLWLSAQRISSVVEEHFNGDGITFAIQDGKNAGQTVEHVHIHIIPRKKFDFENNDQIYNEIEKEREPRSYEEMEKESSELRPLFEENKNKTF